MCHRKNILCHNDQINVVKKDECNVYKHNIHFGKYINNSNCFNIHN